jgi:4'-phosphopantetheinyl transferase
MTSPATGSCAVWWVDPAQVGPAGERCLDADERRALEAFRFDADRLRFLASRVLARFAVATVMGCAADEVTIARTCPSCGTAGHGRPRVVRPSGTCHVSATRAGGRVGVAVSRRVPIGIDVEPCTPFVGEELAATVATERERRWLSAALGPRHDAILWLWTRKEAALKALGVGLAVPPTSVEVLGTTTRVPGCATVHLYRLHPGPGYVAHLASAVPLRQVREHDGEELLGDRLAG